MTNSKSIWTKDYLEAPAKRERLFYNVLSILLFAIGAFLFWEFVYDLCNMIGSIVSGMPAQAVVQLTRVAPFTLLAIIFVYLGISTYKLYVASSAEKRIKGWKKYGIATIVLGVLTVGYVIAGIVTHKYHGIVEGYTTPLFPLDTLLLGIGVIVYGAFSIKYSAVLAKKTTLLPLSEPRKGFCKGAGDVFKAVSYMVSLASFAACIFSIWVVDWTRGNILFNVMLVINYFIPVLMAILYRFYYAEVKVELRRKASLNAGIGMLVVNVIAFAAYMVAVQIQNEAPNINAYGILPIEFTASFNAFPVIIGLNNIICPLTATIFGAKKAK